MKSLPIRRIGGWMRLTACSIIALVSVFKAHAAGTWIALQNQAPEGIYTLLLLPDGTVMAQGVGNGVGSVTWYKLAPGANGGYTNGTWSARASMNYARLYCATQVLPNGGVFVAGAEYGNGTTNAEMYIEASDSWSIIPVPAGIINVNNTTNSNGSNNGGFSDSGSALLDNGQILIEPVYPATSRNTCIYNYLANTWSTQQLRDSSEDEASWVKLPDGSILTVDYNSQTSERYIPSLNNWITDSNVPVNLYDAYGVEMGPGLLLPNGKAFFIGSTPFTALYTPSGGTNPGTWAQGPNIPNNFGAPDAPAAMMNNGKILCCLSPTPFSSTNIFTTPTYFYEYDYTVGATGAFTQVSAPGGGTTLNQATFYSRLLDLPDGTVLYTSGGSQLYVYIPDSTPIAAGKPAVAAYSFNPGGTLHLTGTQFNGISEGSAYGDDVQQSSNYPLIRFTDGSGNVYYGYSYNWSTTGVQTGSKQVSAEASLPGAVFVGPGSFSMQVIANGIASSPIGFAGPVWVDPNFGGSPQIGTYFNPYGTLTQGIAALGGGGEIFLKPGTNHETMTISTPMSIVAVGGDAIIGR